MWLWHPKKNMVGGVRKGEACGEKMKVGLCWGAGGAVCGGGGGVGWGAVGGGGGKGLMPGSWV